MTCWPRIIDLSARGVIEDQEATGWQSLGDKGLGHIDIGPRGDALMTCERSAEGKGVRGHLLLPGFYLFYPDNIRFNLPTCKDLLRARSACGTST